MQESPRDDANAAEHAAPGNDAPPTLVGHLAAALAVALCGSVALGLVEYAVARAFFRAELAGEDWPAALELAVAGRIITSHLLLWTPLLLVSAAAHRLLTRRRPGAAPEPVLVALFGVGVASVIVPADLALAHQDRLIVLIPAVALVLYLALMAYVLGRVLCRRWGPGRLARWGRRGGLVAGLAAIACAVGFWRSPLFNPGAFRASLAAAAPRAGGPPDVLWIVLDTARADRFSLYGYERPTSPRLEQFAGEALVFDRAISNAIWTIPSHASMFTGLPVRAHGLGNGAPFLPPQFKTVAERLAERGYRTALFTNNPLISNDTQLARGFADQFTVFTYMRSLRFSLDHWFEQLGVTPPVPWLDLDYGAALTNHMLARWLSARSDSVKHGVIQPPAPLLVFINYMEIHLPYRTPRPYRQQFLSDEAVRRSYALRQSVHGELEEWLHNEAIIHGYDGMPQLDRDALRGQYDAGVRYLDERVAEALDLFAAAGRLDNTLVVITSDHGEYLDTHGMWSHHFLTYQDVCHIPLIIRPARRSAAPADSADASGEAGPRPPGRVSDVVQLTDLYPTILRAALGPDAAETSARAIDLLDLPTEPGVRKGIVEFYGAGKKYDELLLAKQDRALRHRAARQFAVVEPQYKYIWSSDGMRELFDLAADPGEQRNCAAAMPGEVRRLHEALEHWKTAVPPFDPRSMRDARADFSPEIMRHMKALGYAGGDEPPD